MFRYYAPGLLYVVSAGVAPLSHVLEEVTSGLAAHGCTSRYPEKYSQEMLDVADHLVIVGEVGEELPARTGQDRHHWSDIPQIEGCAYSGRTRRSGEDRRQGP